MKRILPHILAVVTFLALMPACNKYDKFLVEQLQRHKDELGRVVGQLPEAQTPESATIGITFDKSYCWVDAAGSASVHYTLVQPAVVEVSIGNGLEAKVTAISDTEGDIIVTAPDPASPGILQVKVTGKSGIESEALVQVYVRKPYCNIAGPRIETMAYNGFSDALATEENFRKLAEAGITMLSVEGDYEYLDWRKQCRLAEQFGIKVVLFIGYSANCYYVDPENDTRLETIVTEAEQYPAVCAYQIADEPDTYPGPSLALSRKRIGELAPGHPTYINLRPCGGSVDGMAADTYEEYVEYFATTCDLELLTFDQYPVYETGVEHEWYHALEVVSSTARRHGIPFWAFLLCCKEWYRAFPSLENIRLQGNMDLMYGAQCIQFFVWKATSGTDYAPIMNDGTYKPVYYECKEYNREMRNREFIFADCSVLKVRHLGLDYYLHGTHLNKSDLPEAIADITSNGSVAVSFISNSGNEYVVVCNKSWQEKITVDIDFTRDVYTIDREGVFTEYKPGRTSFTIDEGDFLAVKLR